MTALSEPPVSARCGELDLSVDGRAVAHYLPCPELPGDLSPRPYLHPVRTLAGVTVTDARPADHPWHLGLSVAMPDVGGTNFWGGPSYSEERGYERLDDHGRIRPDGWRDQTDSSLVHSLVWTDRHDRVLLHERRRLQALPAYSVPGCWVLAVQFGLTNTTAGDVTLATPGSRGRALAGYGGYFWRLPASFPTMTVWSPSGVHAGYDGGGVHGRTAPWLAATGRAEDGRPWSVLLVPGDPRTARNPWFVRSVDYPAIGSALAFDDSLVLLPGATVSRSVLAVVADTTLSSADCRALHDEVAAGLVRR